VQKLLQSQRVDVVVVSTESELIARTVEDMGVRILRRPPELAGDGVPSIPVFQHIVAELPCEVHVNYNINFPDCDPAVIDRAVDLAMLSKNGEVLSVPFAVWAQTAACLAHYPDPWNITAESVRGCTGSRTRCPHPRGSARCPPAGSALVWRWNSSTRLQPPPHAGY
jgi:hypothetical protein